MGERDSTGDITLIEAVGRPPSLLPLAAVAALKRAGMVLADPAVHPTVLTHAPADAEVSLRAWDEGAVSLAQTRARTTPVVVLLRALGSGMQPRASGVEIRRVPGVPPGSVEPTGPLAGVRVLVTRPRASAGPQRDRFELLGAEAVALPCLRLVPPADRRALDASIETIRDVDGVIVSSRHGVAALFASLTRVGLDARALHGRTVVAVGSSTAQACAARGVVPDVVPSQPRSEGIVSALAERDLLGSRWLHVRAEVGRDTVKRAIEAAGGHFALAVGYRTERPEPPPGVLPWIRRGVDVVCLHSGKTGEHLREILELEGATDALAGAAVISAGPVTTEALQAQGFEVAAQASSPDDDGMLQAVLEHVATATS